MKSQSRRRAVVNGSIAAFLHLCLFAFVVYGILTSTDVAAWPMIWMVMIFFDFPIMLFQWMLPLDLLIRLIEPMIANSSLAGTRIAHINSFVEPALCFGIVGTMWWFFWALALPNYDRDSDDFWNM